MLRLIYAVRKPENTNREDLFDHWANYHVPTFGEPLRVIRRYVLYKSLEVQPSVSNLPYDGFVSVWYDSLEVLNRTMSAALPAALEDERLFIDHNQSRAMLVDDYIKVEPDHPSPVVVFQCVVRKPEVGYSTFAESWLQAGDAAHSRHAEGKLQGHIQSLVRPPAEGSNEEYEAVFDAEAEKWDGIAASYFQSMLLARRYLVSNTLLPGNEISQVEQERIVTTMVRRVELRNLVR